MKKVSIIIPVYNAATTLRKCVESIIFGKEKNIEVILINDCSQDKSLEICLELKNDYSNIVVINNETNFGVSFSRNKGLEIASGEYILFVDSDDYVSKNYVKILKEIMINTKADMVISGFYYHNYLENSLDNITWDKKNSLITMSDSDLIELYDKWLLPQLWNKIFSNEVIKKNNIRFDESINIGEDFEFVLEYLKKSNMNIYLTNKQLYHYIRHNDFSLMSQFYKEDFNDRVDRINKLFLLVNDDYKNKTNDYEKEILNIKKIYAYHIRKIKLSKRKKIEMLKPIFSKKELKRIYNNQNIIILKEKTVRILRFFIKLYRKMTNLLRVINNKMIIHKMRKSLKENNFSIISQNCIGGVFYNDMNLRFLSPTINLYFEAHDFMKFVLNIDYYLSCDLIVEWDENYPIGILNDIKIHFMHYDNCSIALRKWNERKKRILKNKVIVLCTDRDGFDDSCFESWKKIKYPKILYTTNKKFLEDIDSVYYDNKIIKKNGADFISNRFFYKKNILINKISNI